MDDVSSNATRVPIDAWSVVRYLPIAVPVYGIVLSFLSLAPFWSSFRVNFMEYVELASIPKLAFNTIIPQIIAGAIGIVAGVTSKPHEGLRPRTKSEGLVGIAILTVLPVYFMPHLWPLPLSVILGVYLFRTVSRLINPYFASAWLSGAIASLLTLLPIVLATMGLVRAHLVKYGRYSEVATVEFRDELNTALSDSNNLYHIGHLGEFDFFYVPSEDATHRISVDRIAELKVRRRVLCPRCYADAMGEVQKTPQPWPFYYWID